MSKPLPTLQAYKTKWATNYKASGQYAKAGVQAVTVAPGVAAAAASDRWLANTQAAAAKYKANVGAVSVTDWQNAYINKGIPRMSAGADQAVATKDAAWTTLLGNIATVQQQVASLPRGDVNANIARAVAWMTNMHQISNKGA